MERIEGNKKVKRPCIYPDIIVIIARNTGASFFEKKKKLTEKLRMMFRVFERQHL